MVVVIELWHKNFERGSVMKSAREKIIEYLKDNDKATQVELSENLQIQRSTVARVLRDLMEENTVERVGTNRNLYYILKEGMTAEQYDNISSEIKKRVILVEESMENVKEQVDNANQNINKIYIDIISLMSVFVAIIALIITNADIVLKITESNIKKYLLDIVLVNLSVCICLAVFVILIRFIVLKPLSKKK